MLRVDHRIQSIAAKVNDGGRVDAHVRGTLAAVERMDYRRPEVRIQEHRAARRIDGVNRVIVGGYIHDSVNSLMTTGGDIHVGHHQRLSLCLIVKRNRVQHSERRTVNGGGGEHRFLRIPAGPVIVVVISRHRNLRCSQKAAG